MKNDEAGKLMEVIAKVFRECNFFTAAMARNGANLSNEEVINLATRHIHQVLMEAALYTCAPYHIRFVTKAILKGPADTKFMIITGHPSGFEHHTLGLTDSLYQEPKEALIQAYESGQMVYVSDVLRDPRTRYLKGWPWFKEYWSLAVLPFGHKTDFAVLGVIDVDERKRELDQAELLFLSQLHRMVNDAYVEAIQSLFEARKMRVVREQERVDRTRKELNEFQHQVRNEVMMLGGFLELFWKEFGKSQVDEKLTSYQNIIRQHLYLLLDAMNLITAVSKDGSAIKTLREQLEEVFNQKAVQCQLSIELAAETSGIDIPVMAAVPLLLLEIIGKSYGMGQAGRELQLAVNCTQVDNSLQVEFCGPAMDRFSQQRIRKASRLVEELIQGIRLTVDNQRCVLCVPYEGGDVSNYEVRDVSGLESGGQKFFSTGNYH